MKQILLCNRGISRLERVSVVLLVFRVMPEVNIMQGTPLSRKCRWSEILR